MGWMVRGGLLACMSPSLRYFFHADGCIAKLMPVIGDVDRSDPFVIINQQKLPRSLIRSLFTRLLSLYAFVLKPRTRIPILRVSISD